jgi:hypothetical protein
MNLLFSENDKIFQEEIAIRLARKIFGEPVKCCLEATKPGTPGDAVCPYADTEDHVYSRRVSNALDEVVYVCKMLSMPPVALNSYNRSTLWEKYFSQSAYMKYHIENWYINVIRLEDMFLILLNEVFQLGIKKELVGYEVIHTNSNLPEIAKRNLKSLHKSCRPIRVARIMLIHHQTLFEKKLYEIEKDETLVQLLREGGKGDEIAETLEEIELFAKRFKAPTYRKSKIKYILESNNNLLNYISATLLLLEGDYMDRQQLLAAKRRSDP